MFLELILLSIKWLNIDKWERERHAYHPRPTIFLQWKLYHQSLIIIACKYKINDNQTINNVIIMEDTGMLLGKSTQQQLLGKT